MAGGSPLRPAARPVLALAALVATALFITALFLLRPGVVAGVLTACSAVIAAVMVRAAVTGRAAGPRLRVLALAAGIGLTAVAGAASAVASQVASEATVGGVPLPAEIPLVTLFLVAGTFLPAILRPQQRRDSLTKLRIGLDVVGVTSCLLFASWMVLFGNGGERRGATITALIFGGSAAATVAVNGVHALRQRAALQWCGPAAALLLISMTALVTGLDHPGEPNADIAVVVAALAVNVAAGLLWFGSVRLSPDQSPMPPPGSEPSAGFPLLALPVLGSALVTVYHLLNGGSLDSASIALGSLAITAVAAREWVSSVALRRQAGHLTDQGNRLRSLMFGSADVAMVLDSNLAVRWQSPATARQFGLSDQEVLGRAVSALVHPEQVEAAHEFLLGQMTDPDRDACLPVRLRDGYGRWRETEWTTSGADPAEAGHTLVVHVRDVTNMRDLEQALSESAHLDRQTGLANLEGLVRAAELVPDAGAMIVVELGGLTAIGDVRGRDLAELALVEAARRLRTQIAGADIPARIGETRFAVLTHSGAVRAHLLAGQLVNALAAPYMTAGTVSHLSAWGGLADVTEEHDTDEVVRRAALALRSVRSGPPGAVEWYDAEMETRLLRRSTLEQDLPGAVSRGEIDLRYQPVVELDGRRPVGVEALPTWKHPRLGPVPADELLALAEDLGLLGQIEHAVLHRSCRLLARWRVTHESLWLAVNVRPRQLVDPSFQASLHTALEDHDLPHSALVIEIAEQHLSDVRGEGHHPPVEEIAAQLGRLRADGVRTAVDNFGTGPTSLSRLRILPIDLLKIDREVFADPVETFRQAGAVMDVAVTLGRRLGMEVIAHGLEDALDLDTALTAGCRLGQGDLLGRPMPAEHLEALLEQSRV